LRGAERPLSSRLPPFRPRPPWIGGDLQTLRNPLGPNTGFESASAESRRYHVALSEPGAGALAIKADLPENERSLTLIVLVHGLGGCEDSSYMRRSAAAFLRDGHTVIRLNLRGAGPSARTSPHPYHAGLTDDLRAAFARIADLWPGRPSLALGFSLGGHLLLRLASESGCPAGLVGIATVSAPLDLAATQRRFGSPRNRFYERYVLACLRRDLRRWAEFGNPFDPPAPRSIYAFDREVVVPAHGFENVESYYREMSVAPRLSRLALPAMVIHAADDPWIPAEMYERTDWPVRDDFVVCLGASGGHVGFHANGLDDPWYIDAVRAFRDCL